MWNALTSSSNFVLESLETFAESTGVAGLFANMGWGSLIMICVAFFLLYLAIKHKFEPLLLLTIAFGIFADEPSRSEPLPYGTFCRGARPLGYFRRPGGTPRLPLSGREARHLSLPYLRGRGRHDRLRPADRQPQELPAGSRGAAWYFPHVHRRLCARVLARRGRFDRHHRRRRRSHVDLPDRDSGSRAARPDRRGRLLLHGPRAGDPAADHAHADHREGA